MALALAAGALHALCFAPAELPRAATLLLGVVYFLALRAASWRMAARLGLAFGLGWFGVGVHWVYISLHGHGELAAPLAALATAALAALLALFPAAALGAGVAAGPDGTARRALGIVAAWTLADWLRGVLFGGFPWLATGYAQTDGAPAGFAPWLGVYGVGAAEGLSAMALVYALTLSFGPRPRPLATRLRMAAAVAVCALVLLGGAALRGIVWSQDAGAPIRVRLVQGNIPQDLKFGEGGLQRSIERYLPALDMAPQPDARGASGAVPDLIVFPESAFPIPVNDLPDDVLQALTDVDRRKGAALVFGVFIVEPGPRYFNSAVGLAGRARPAQADGTAGTGARDAAPAAPSAPQRYSKRHLVPFGEFIPFGMHWFVQLLQIPIGDQEAGDEFQAPMQLAGQRIAVNICFEDLFGGEILAAWHDPRDAPTMLLNLSNLAWFDDSIALPQHLQISRMRALETARPLLRATNTGVTAVIDERGNVRAQLPIQRDGVLEAFVQGKSGVTPFVRWGNSPILLACAALWLACRLASRPRSGAQAKPARAEGFAKLEPGKQ
jgi:apolipoprotein N-acyltransferase